LDVAVDASLALAHDADVPQARESKVELVSTFEAFARQAWRGDRSPQEQANMYGPNETHNKAIRTEAQRGVLVFDLWPNDVGS
jgi:hypothetical protein